MRTISGSLNTAPRPLIVSTELYSLAINRFPWEAVFPQSRSLHIHCTKDINGLPVMRSLTSMDPTLHAVGTLVGSILGAQHRSMVRLVHPVLLTANTGGWPVALCSVLWVVYSDY